jgi:hypothetical protein
VILKLKELKVHMLLILYQKKILQYINGKYNENEYDSIVDFAKYFNNKINFDFFMKSTNDEDRCYDYYNRIDINLRDFLSHIIQKFEIKLIFNNDEKIRYITKEMACPIIKKLLINTSIDNKFCEHRIMLMNNIENTINKDLFDTIMKHDFTQLSQILIARIEFNFNKYEKSINIFNTESFEDLCLNYSKYQGFFPLCEFYLENKIEPTRKAFNNILRKFNNFNEYFNQIDFYDLEYTRCLIECDCDNGLNIINLFIKYGYDITYDDIKNAAKRLIIIRNVKYMIKNFDVTYLHVCHRVHKSFDNIISDLYLDNYSLIEYPKPDITCLLHECEYDDIKSVKRLMTEFNVIPNIECVRSACLKSDINIIRCLVSHGIKIDLVCLNNAKSRENKYHIILNYVYNEFKKNYPDTEETLIINNSKKYIQTRERVTDFYRNDDLID